jgi:hypothetical protein
MFVGSPRSKRVGGPPTQPSRLLWFWGGAASRAEQQPLIVQSVDWGLTARRAGTLDLFGPPATKLAC